MSINFSLPQSWAVAPETQWADEGVLFSEGFPPLEGTDVVGFTEIDFAREIVPQSVRENAKPGATYTNPASGVTLIKQQNGQWKRVGGNQSSSRPPAKQQLTKVKKSAVLAFKASESSPEEQKVFVKKATKLASHKQADVFKFFFPKKEEYSSDEEFLKARINQVLGTLVKASNMGYTDVVIAVDADPGRAIRKYATGNNKKIYNIARLSIVSISDQNEDDYENSAP